MQRMAVGNRLRGYQRNHEKEWKTKLRGLLKASPRRRKNTAA
jgi:hypothetical protein